MAIGAVCALWSSYLQLGLEIQFDRVALCLFSSTLVSYVLHRLLALRNRDELALRSSELLSWSLRHHFLLRCFFFLGVVGSLGSFLMLKQVSQLLLSVTGLVTVLYSYPFIYVRGRTIRLRDIGLSKIFLIALIWALSTVLLPVVEFSISIGTAELLLLAERFLFLFVITVPFDIRDIDYDAGEGLRTVPILVGIKKARLLCLACLLLLAGTSAVRAFLLHAISVPQLFSLLVCYMLTSVLIMLTTKNRSDHFFIGAMDGTLVLMFVLLVLV